MNSKMTPKSHLSTNEPKIQQKQKQTKQTTKTGTESQNWRSHGRLLRGMVEKKGEKVQGIRSIIGPWLVWLCGLSVGCEPKGHWFNSQAGHMPELQTRSPVGGV